MLERPPSGRRSGLSVESKTAKGLIVCNDFGNNVPYTAYMEAFSQIRAPIVFPVAAPNLEPRDDIWPTETAPCFAEGRNRVGATPLGLPAGAAEGSADHQFPLRGAALSKGRCLIPASHFF